MEQQQNWTQLLELLERPAFTVEQGRVSWANREALARLVSTGQEIHSLLQTGAEEYAHLGSGSLCLSLQIADTQQGAAVRRLAEGVDLFLLDQEADLAGLKQLALAARQLREPLGNTMIAADRLFPELELTEAPGLQEQMARMNQGLFQLLRIINNMADAEQYLAGALPNRETTALGGFFGEILEKAAALGEKAGVQLIYTPPVREGMGNIDRQKVERAVYNLLSNALRFTPKGGLIRVSLTLERERAVLRVQDNGDGLHRQIQRDLFNRYRRSPAVEDGRFGLGLGLLLVRADRRFARRLPSDQRGPGGRNRCRAVSAAESAGKQRPLLSPDCSGLRRLPGSRPGGALSGTACPAVRGPEHQLNWSGDRCADAQRFLFSMGRGALPPKPAPASNTVPCSWPDFG